MEKGQEFMGGGVGTSVLSSGIYDKMHHISHYWGIMSREYVRPLLRGYMPRKAAQPKEIGGKPPTKTLSSHNIII